MTYCVDKSVDRVDKSLTRGHLAAGTGPLEPVLGIFAKPPVPGQVKTRLCPPFSLREATELYRISLLETVARMSRGRFSLTLFFAGDADYFATTFPRLPRIFQGEGDLGQRLERALGTLLERGHGAAALIGADSPDLPLAYVEQAFAALQQADVLVVPARDGGYVLIGERRHQPSLFQDMPWSTSALLEETRRRARTLAIDYRELQPWEDVDDLIGLRRLIARSPQSTTARFVLKHPRLKERLALPVVSGV